MKKRIIGIAIIIIVVFLVTWRLWPNSFSNLMPVDEDTVISFSAYAMVDYYNYTYLIDNSEAQNDHLQDMWLKKMLIKLWSWGQKPENKVLIAMGKAAVKHISQIDFPDM